MMNLDEIVTITSKISCSLLGMKLVLKVNRDYRYIQVEATSPCAVTGEPYTWTGRKWLLSPHMTETELVCTAFKAFQAALEHELRESFRYYDVQVFDPHRAIGALLSLDGLRDTRDEPHGAFAHKESVK